MSEQHSTVAYREIEGFPGYRVGNDGSVWSCLSHKGVNTANGDHWYPSGEWRLMKTVLESGHGYRQIWISRNGRRFRRKVHHLVLESFVGPCPEGMECRHLDGVRDNNALTNLKWGTKPQNYNDRRSHGTENDGEKNGRARLTEAQVAEIRSRSHENQHNLAAEFGVAPPTINHILCRRTWKHVA